MLIRAYNSRVFIVLGSITDPVTLRYFAKIGKRARGGEVSVTEAKFFARPGVIDKRNPYTVARVRSMQEARERKRTLQDVVVSEKSGDSEKILRGS